MPAFAVLLVLAGCAAGLFYYNAGFSETRRNDAPTEAAPLAVQPAPPERPSAPEAAPTPDSASVVEADPQVSKNKTAAAAADSAKKGKAATKDTGRGQDPNVVVDENSDTVYMGNVKITENGIEPNTYVDKRGVRRPIPPPTGGTVWPGITKDQFNSLSPEDRQKLIEARRKLMLIQKQKLPVPPPTPQQ